ncbi:hypothetical protein ACFWRD_11405, partial [Streptomyces sindenensis]|uniref:hypothetical protein n=1 Tax=Streptomyces sindenensis TaxID=67363 RepID=UPI00365F7B88
VRRRTRCGRAPPRTPKDPVRPSSAPYAEGPGAAELRPVRRRTRCGPARPINRVLARNQS